MVSQHQKSVENGQREDRYTDKRTAFSGPLVSAPLDVPVAGDLRWLTMIKQIKFVSIPVADQNVAGFFYEKLGFTIITSNVRDSTEIELRVPKAETGWWCSPRRR